MVRETQVCNWFCWGLCWVLGELVHLLSFRFFIYKMKTGKKTQIRVETMKGGTCSQARQEHPPPSFCHDSKHTRPWPVGPQVSWNLGHPPVWKSNYTWQGVLPDPMASWFVQLGEAAALEHLSPDGRSAIMKQIQKDSEWCARVLGPGPAQPSPVI